MSMDPYGPSLYMCQMDIFFLVFSYIFLMIIIPKTLLHPHIINTHITDLYYHHSIMYDNNPLYSPFLLHILLLFVRMFLLSLLV